MQVLTGHTSQAPINVLGVFEHACYHNFATAGVVASWNILDIRTGVFVTACPFFPGNDMSILSRALAPVMDLDLHSVRKGVEC